MLKQCIAITILLCITPIISYATDSLLLSNEEMQKLKKYFPEDEGSERQQWNGNPITVLLPVGKEKRLIFSSHVTVDIKGQLTTEQLKIINNDKSLYLTAQKDIPSTRIYITQDTNKVMFVDIATDNRATSNLVYIDSPGAKSVAAMATSLVDATNNKTNSNSNIGVVALMRYAWQQLYAPKHLVTINTSIIRTPMQTHFFISTLVYGDKVIANPKSSWKADNLYITVIELRNKYPHKTYINLKKDICGTWQAGLLYPRTILQASGSKVNDSTTLFLISKKPFAENMEICNGHA